MTGRTRKDARKTRARIVRYMYEHYSDYDYYPTLKEIGAAVGLAAQSAVRGHLHRLAKCGWVRLGPPRTQRTTVLTEDGKWVAMELPPLEEMLREEASE